MHSGFLLAVALLQGTPDREMATDRPDKTESPYTVPAARWQVEMDAIAYARQGSGITATHSWNLAAFNLKRALGSRADVQLLVEPFRREVAGSGTSRIALTVLGDVVGRFKFNVFGNDGGRVALGVMPFVSLPRAEGTRQLEGGFIIPLALELAPGWSFGTMLETDLVRLEGTTGRRPVLVYSATVGRDLSSSIGAYAEIFSAFMPAVTADRWDVSLDFGATWGISSEVQLDGGINFGLTAAADDVNPFLGVSVRF